MKNIETPDKMHLARLLDELRYGKFLIPDFQREFEWSPADVKELLRSIFEDYYIGTLLLWRASRDNQELLSCESIYGFEGKSEPQHIVLDGQQRLSALYYAFFAPKRKFPNRKNRYLFIVKLDKLLNEEFDDAFDYEWLTRRTESFLKQREKQFKEKILPISVLGEQYWYEWFREYKNYWAEEIGEEQAEKEREKLEHFFKDHLSNYDISYIELDRDIEVSKVCDIFTRINSTGITLTIFDLLNALMRPKGIHLKDMWRKTSNKLGDYEWQRTKVHLLQTISILEQGYCAPKYLYYLVPGARKIIKHSNGSKESVVLLQSCEDFIKRWDFVAEKLKWTLNSLANPRDFGAIKPEFVPYPTMVPILTALNIEREKEKYTDKRMEIEAKIKRWYWASVFMQNYSSAVDSQMTHDYYAMQKWFEDDSLIPRVVEQFENELDNLDLHKENTATSAVYKSIFNILVRRGARDWTTFDLPEYSTLEDHHIVPRSWGLKKGLNRKIDTILNRTPLSKKTNRQIISDRLPNIYLRELFNKAKNKEEVYELLESHLISKKATDILMRENFSPEDYNEFTEERYKTVIQEIKSLVGIEKAKTISKLISPEKPFSNALQIEKTIKRCESYLYWIDKYFGRSGLEIIANALSFNQDTNIRDIKILTSLEKADEGLKKDFKRFKEELKNKGVKVEMRILVSKSIASSIHDRWLIGKYQTYNIPSPDVIKRGQYSEIKETDAKPPFEKWWDGSLDIIKDWQKIITTK
jgi:hypothetical protein